jgi:hypothetical protein
VVQKEYDVSETYTISILRYLMEAEQETIMSRRQKEFSLNYTALEPITS